MSDATSPADPSCMRREYKRILLADLTSAMADGWMPVTENAGAVGCDPFAGGTGACVLVERAAAPAFVDVSGLGVDEVRVIERIVQRVRMGQRQYGPFKLATNPKDWKAEAAEELLDATVYLAAQSLRDKP